MPNVVVKETSESTNADAIELARQGCDAFTTVWAHKQTRGRGQRGRTWVSVEGSVFWSVVLKPNRHRHTDIIYVMALAVHDTLRMLLPADAALAMKWPNDTLLGGRKLGGTLTEASGAFSNNYPDWVVSGTGINVVPIGEDSSMIYPPTSLHQSGYMNITREEIIKLLLENTVKEVSYWEDFGFAQTRERYLDCTFGLNTHMRIGVNQEKGDYREGFYRDINEEGAMVLENSAGDLELIYSGEVIRNVI